MTLSAGSRLGPYEILGPLGAGGMGEVWRARDARLGREVAIKSLPATFAQDPERLARFEREARLLAALQNARIATIHGLEESSGRRYLVMELVAGESLANRIASGPIPVREALEIARQVAEGLEAAHEKGIVHRDLKPSNVQIAPDGAVKLLDFGLAKTFDADTSGEAAAAVSRSPTISAQMTGTGIILGTAAYMSPEQARGKPVDRRSDVWSFGVLLFEMLSGRRLFTGETVSDTLAAVLRADPDWTALPGDTPPIIRRLLARCLQRDPKQRLHDVGDARLEIEEAIAQERGGSQSAASFAAPPHAAAPPKSRRLALLAAAGLAIVALAFLAGRAWRGQTPARSNAAVPIHSVVNLPPATFLAGWASPVLAISRDGRKLAYVASHDEEGANQLYVHHLDRGETQLVPGSETAEGPFFSPDGQWVAFAVDVSLTAGRPGQLKKFSLVTGLTQPITPIPDYGGGDWGLDGTILLTPTWTSGPWKVPSDGGSPDKTWEKVRVAGKETGRALAWPQLLPGGQSALVVDADASVSGEAAVLDLSSRELHSTGAATFFARYLPTGHLLTMQPDASVHAVPFDSERRRVSGAGVAVLKDVAIGANGAPALAVSESGSLVYATGYLRASGRELLRLARVTLSGQVQPLPFETDTFIRRPLPSPDGRRIAVSTWDGTIWIYDVVRGTRARLPRGKNANLDYLTWSPDGERIAFAGSAEGHPGISLFWQKADGSTPPEVLIGGGPEKAAMGFTPDGRSLLYRQFEKPDGLWVMDLREKREPRRLMEGTFRWVALSPDGRWIAYDSSESGIYEVYGRRYPSLDGKVQLSAGGGGGPQWARDGRALTYFVADRIFRVRLAAGEALEPSSPELLFEAKGMRSISLVPDGKGFIAAMRTPDSGIVRQLHLVTNWFEELDRLAPAGTKR